MTSREQLHHPVKVYSGNLWQAQIIQGLLEANDIICILRNDTASVLISPYADTAGDVLVMVDDSDKESATLIIEECSLSSNPYN